MARFQLLVGAQAFWERLKRDISEAQHRVCLQVMTFEGDAVGQEVSRALHVSTAADKRVLVDAYTRYVINDRFLFSPLAMLDRGLVAEARATRAMFRALEAAGVGVRFTNRVGWAFCRYPSRNHKKLMVIDDVAYFGGVNFSEHNFAWHDLMLRIDDREVAQTLAADFEASWQGRPIAGAFHFDQLEVLSLDGRSNARLFAPILERIAQAQRSVQVISPYLTFPFDAALASAQARGAKVTLLTPWPNNKPIIRDYLLWAADRAGFDVRLQEKMGHMKAILIDDAVLILGSSNFDFVSYHAEDEIVALISDPALVQHFRATVLEPDLASTRPLDKALPHWRGRASYLALRSAEQLTRLATKLPGR